MNEPAECSGRRACDVGRRVRSARKGRRFGPRLGVIVVTLVASDNLRQSNSDSGILTASHEWDTGSRPIGVTNPLAEEDSPPRAGFERQIAD
jgi:hypothetical protein